MFRERPRTRLSDRIRGKSGDEVFQELRQELDKDRKMFFDSNPNWGFTPAGSAFPRRHMFGDEDDLPTSRGRSTDLRSHLEDLANRHPEFADHLRSPPGWVSDLRAGGVGGASGKWAGPSGSSSGSRERFFEPGAEGGHNSQPSEEGAGLSQHGLRNTVPDINSQTASNEAARSQRSMSAPPDHNRQAAADKPQRFVSKIEINPVNPATGQTAADAADCSKPPPAPPSTKPNMQQPPQHKTSTVRHIPIFVEGRDEPILPKNVDQEYQAPPPPPTQPQFTSSHQFQPQNQEQHRKPSFQGYQHHHQQQSPPPPPPPSTQQQQPSPPSRPRDQPDAAPVAPEQPKVDVNDPIYKVQLIQKEVDALKQKIEGFECQTRADKEYIYLDEMLTRNLLKLDNISTEGKEKVRAVRKEAINSVQKCISLLESKVKEQQSMDVDKGQNDAAVAVEKDVQEEKSVDQGGEEQPAAAQENGPVEKVPKTDAQPAAEANNDNNPNEIKC